MRYPFPSTSKVLSLRANDTSADHGVLTKSSNAKIVKMPDAKHINMYDAGPKKVKDKIVQYIQEFLND